MGVFFNNNGKKLERQPVANEAAVAAAEEGEVSIISVQAKITGVIETNVMLQIEGVIEGDIKGDGVVHISSTGKITGNISAKSIFIDGEVKGDIIADKVEIGEKGKVYANITSATFVIQEGGVFEGSKKLKMNLIKDKPLKPKESKDPIAKLEKDKNKEL